MAAADCLLSSETVATMALLQASCKLLLSQKNKRGKLMSEKKKKWHRGILPHGYPTPIAKGLYTDLILYCYVNNTLSAIISCLEKYYSSIVTWFSILLSLLRRRVLCF